MILNDKTERLTVICLVFGGSYLALLNLTYVIPQPILMIFGIIVTFGSVFSVVYLFKSLKESNPQVTEDT